MSRPGGQTSTVPTVTAPTVGTSSAQAIAANPARTSLIMSNPSASATVYLAIAPTAAVANAAGTIAIAAGVTLQLDGIRCTAGFNAIASAASTPFTFWEF